MCKQVFSWNWQCSMRTHCKDGLAFAVLECDDGEGKKKKQIIDWITSSKASNLCVQEWFLVWLQCNKQQQQKNLIHPRWHRKEIVEADSRLVRSPPFSPLWNVTVNFHLLPPIVRATSHLRAHTNEIKRNRNYPKKKSLQHFISSSPSSRLEIDWNFFHSHGEKRNDQWEIWKHFVDSEK